MFVEGTLHLQHELKALQSFAILLIGTEVKVCTTRAECQLGNSWIIWGELIQTGSFNNCFPGVHTHSWTFEEFLCGKVILSLTGIWAPLGKKIHFISIWNYVQILISISFHLNLLNWGNRGRKLKKTQTTEETLNIIYERAGKKINIHVL